MLEFLVKSLFSGWGEIFREMFLCLFNFCGWMGVAAAITLPLMVIFYVVINYLYTKKHA